VRKSVHLVGYSYVYALKYFIPCLIHVSSNLAAILMQMHYTVYEPRHSVRHSGFDMYVHLSVLLPYLI
jgi:hypothetical protein